MTENGGGSFSDDLREAVLAALKLDPEHCHEAALKYTSESCIRQSLGHLETAHRDNPETFATSRPAG